MKNKSKSYLYIVLITILLIVIPSAIARFVASKRLEGNINILNHPCKTPIGPAAKYILNKEGGVSVIDNKPTPDFSQAATTKEGMFVSEDDYCKSYYYRGQADNWVSFAGFYWRIIRINGDGSIRLIYSGTKTNNTAAGTTIGSSPYNTVYNAEKYGDYKISKIKPVVDNWYRANILGKAFENKIADPGFCNDMTKTSTTDFGAYDRLENKKMPSFKCPNKSRDLLSKSNNKLTYPVGLLVWDEASFAGGARHTPNSNYYIYTGRSYWTMTPAYLFPSDLRTAYIYRDGRPSRNETYESIDVRPVINLKSEVAITSGDGTLASPYIIN